MRRSLVSLALFSTIATCSRIKTLVTFGDSYTDQSRIAVFFFQNAFPPKDYQQVYPPDVLAANGGASWVRYAEIYGNLKVGRTEALVGAIY
jgi:hypothetical protein